MLNNVSIYDINQEDLFCLNKQIDFVDYLSNLFGKEHYLINTSEYEKIIKYVTFVSKRYEPKVDVSRCRINFKDFYKNLDIFSTKYPHHNKNKEIISFNELSKKWQQIFINSSKFKRSKNV